MTVPLSKLEINGVRDCSAKPLLGVSFPLFLSTAFDIAIHSENPLRIERGISSCTRANEYLMSKTQPVFLYQDHESVNCSISIGVEALRSSKQQSFSHILHSPIKGIQEHLRQRTQLRSAVPTITTVQQNTNSFFVNRFGYLLTNEYNEWYVGI